MTKILLIETATAVCSVGVCRGNQMAAIRETSRQNSHAAMVAVFIDEVLKEAGISPSELDAIAVSMGPGSYTGLRIGVSSAKGLCYALSKPLIAVSTLKSLAAGMIAADTVQSPSSLYIPMIDARRMEVYMAVFNRQLDEITPVSAEILTAGCLEVYAPAPLILAGDGAQKAADMLNYPSDLFLDSDSAPSVRYMMPLALQAFHNNEFVDTAYFEPFYLKDFVAGKPKVKGLE